MMTCDSAWSCPCCSPKLAAARANTLTPQVQTFLQAPGSTAFLITLTLRHQRGDDLGALMDALRGTWGRVTSGKEWQAIRDVGRVEFISGGDVTWSPAAGWHPHRHAVLLLGPEHADGGEAVALWLRDRWLKVLKGKGFDALQAAQDVQRLTDPGKAIAYTVRPSVVFEAVGVAAKRGRGEGSGLTAFEVLKVAVDGLQAKGLTAAHARHLWAEYAGVMRGRRQSTTSRGLKLAVDQELAQVEEEEAQVQPAAVELAWLTKPATVELDRRGLTVPLLQAVEDARPAGPDAMMHAAAKVLGLLGAAQGEGWGLIHPPGDPPPEYAAPPDPMT